jgi:hypothetical protein
VNAQSHATGKWRLGLGWLILAGVIVLLHGRSLWFGWFMDDYAHVRQLRKAAWSLKDLVGACRLELVGGVADFWFLPETTLRFFRPASFAVMKLVYVLSDWSPLVQHAASLCWHLLACGLLMTLLVRMGIGVWTALLAAGLFAAHAGHVVTVQWIACQTELMVTSALLGATLCYGEAFWWGRQKWWFVGTLILFVFALGCRENAIMLPAVLAVGDALGARQERRWRWGPWIALGAVAIAYLFLRNTMLGGIELPPRPYVIPPSAPDFPRFVFDKLLYYLLGEFALIPVAPIGGLPVLRSWPMWFYGASLVVVGGVGWAVLRNWQERIARVSAAWLILFMLPVLPTFASPHHLYLPGIGWSLLIGLGLSGLGQLAQTRRYPITVGLSRIAVLLFAALNILLGQSYTYHMLGTGQAVEDRVIDELASAPTPIRSGDTVYIANLPMIAHYARLGLEDRLGIENVRLVVLTWSPRLLGMVTPSNLSRIDDTTIEMTVTADRYFSGPIGRLVREADSPAAALAAGTIVETEAFSARMLAVDAEGVHRLRFEFKRPLSAPGTHLFWGSRSRWATQVVPKITSHKDSP